MFKTKLQELCHGKRWAPPKYSTAKNGQDHDPRYHATVNVNGQSFISQTAFMSIKKAQDDAAKIAFEYFLSPSTTPFPPSPGSLGGSIEVDRDLSAGETSPRKVRKLNETSKENGLNAVAEIAQNKDKFGDVQHLSKNHLQIYARKNNLPLPVYCCERIGPPHSSRFKCKVTINGRTYESSDFFSTVKEAEHTAAKAALMSLLADEVEVARICDDLSTLKILLQELAQKEGCHLPIYRTSKSGEDHKPVFISTVEIGVDCFTGGEARTKKQAEMNAAMIAYTTIKSRMSNDTCGLHSPSDQVKEDLSCSSSSLLSDVVAYFQQNVQPKVASSSHSVEEEMAAGSPANDIISFHIKQLLERSALCLKGLMVDSRNANVANPEGGVASPPNRAL